MAYWFVSGELSWRISCNILNRWRVSDDESRRVLSEGEGACSTLIKVRSHLASEREARMDDPTRWCENDTDKWKRVTRGSCSQARAPLFCLSGLSGGHSRKSSTAISACPRQTGCPVQSPSNPLPSKQNLEN